MYIRRVKLSISIDWRRESFESPTHVDSPYLMTRQVIEKVNLNLKVTNWRPVSYPSQRLCISLVSLSTHKRAISEKRLEPLKTRSEWFASEDKHFLEKLISGTPGAPVFYVFYFCMTFSADQSPLLPASRIPWAPFCPRGCEASPISRHPQNSRSLEHVFRRRRTKQNRHK